MKIILVLVLSILSTTVYCQYNSKLRGNASLNQPAYQTNEKGERFKPAEFPGGMEKLYSRISRRLKYPRDARKNKIEGKVYVQFVIDKDGIIKEESVHVVQGFYESCDNEAIRVVKGLGKWIPGKNVDTYENAEMKFVIPIIFKL